jgi:enamine deaminase RidA (YjgF/YER057c/UK114 family)
MSVTERLAQLGIALPVPAAPVAAYVPYIEVDGMLYLSGQLPFRPDGTIITGRLGESLDILAGQEAARRCAIMILAQIGAAVGGEWGRVERLIKLGAFISSAANFTDQPKVANGASEFLVDILGDAGRHTRSAVGVPVLPLGAAVEIDAVVALRA